MKYFSYALTALGAVGLLSLQFSAPDGDRPADTLPMLFAGACLTMGLLLLVISDESGGAH